MHLNISSNVKNVKMNKRDLILIFSFYTLTLLPLFLKLFEFGKEHYFITVFLSGFIPVYATHSTSLGLSFKNIYFSCLWCIMIVLNWFLYDSIIHFGIPLILSYLVYNLLRFIFIRINNEDPIPIFIGPGTGLKYNNIENRKENKRDGLFTAISFLLGMSILLIVLIMIK